MQQGVYIERMTTLIKLFYAGAIAALFVLLVAFGIRTFYAGPQQPEPPIFQPFPRFPSPPAPPGTEPAPQPTPTAEERGYQEEQRRFQEEFQRYEDERAEYRRNVFLIAALAGIVAVAGGIALPRRTDAIRLGLVAGGLGTILYSVIQAGGDLDDAGSTLVFFLALAGFALVLAAGYRWLTTNETS
jgi:hypothetical protein